jgi:hypothetical protein
MPKISFDALPGHGRLWVFPATRDLTDAEANAFLTAVDDFLATWSAHGAALRSGRELIERRFLLVGVDVDAEAPSGCSIDALMTRLRAVGDSMGVALIDHAPVWFRQAGSIRTLSRPEFRALAAEGDVDADVHVFDTTLTRIDDFRAGKLERPATDTWHGRTFFRAHAGG